MNPIASTNGHHHPLHQNGPAFTEDSQADVKHAKHSQPLCIAIVGFGNFGQFLAKRFLRQGHRVIGASRGNYYSQAKEIGAIYVQDYNALMDYNPDVVILCTSIMSLSKVLSKFPIERLESSLVVDVLSVKMYPRQLLLEKLSSQTDILCTHPMFGPESGKYSWKKLPFVYEKVRIQQKNQQKCERFLKVFELEDCEMVNMTCSQHDSHAASTQFITHTTGRMLAALNVQSTPVNTLGYESLLEVVDTTCKDSFDLFYGLYRYNPHSRGQLDKLEESLKELRRRLRKKEEQEEQARTLETSK